MIEQHLSPDGAWLRGEYYPFGVCCTECGIDLTDDNVRERMIDPGDPTQPWEGELPLPAQMERAGSVELVCVTCNG